MMLYLTVANFCSLHYLSTLPSVSDNVW